MHNTPHSSDSKLKMSQSQKRLWSIKSYRAKQKKSRTFYNDPEWLKKIRKAHLGKGQYEGLDKSALQNFRCCHDRVRDGKCPSIQWPRTREGYISFLKEIGQKPNDGQKWSVGRKNHSKGYVKGNVEWQIHAFNSSEPRLRRTK